jgi:hypothetical protein
VLRVLMSANALKSRIERADTGVDEGGIFLGHRQGPRPASHSPPGGLVASPDTSRDSVVSSSSDCMRARAVVARPGQLTRRCRLRTLLVVARLWG